MSGPGYPPDRCTGPAGEVNASLRWADAPAELAPAGGGAARYLATGGALGSEWPSGPESPSGSQSPQR